MIYINGIIGNGKDENNLLSLVEKVNREKGDTIHVMIDSIGGDPEVGFLMYDYLKSLDKTVITESVNNCASAATLPFLAGDKRIAGSTIMIHNPYLDSISGDKKELESAAKWIGEIEQKCAAIYTESTSVDIDTLKALMDNETYLSPSQATSLGFATESKITALAKLDKSNINKQKENMVKRENPLFKGKSFNAYAKGKHKAKMMDITDENGAVLHVEREDGDPEVGDIASPNGLFSLPDKKRILVEDGKITDIYFESSMEDVTEDDVQELIDLAEEIADENKDLKDEKDRLEDELEEVKGEVATAKAKAKTDEEEEILKAVMRAGGKDWLARQCSSYKPTMRSGSSKGKVNGGNALSDRVQQLKNRG